MTDQATQEAVRRLTAPRDAEEPVRRRGRVGSAAADGADRRPEPSRRVTSVTELQAASLRGRWPR